MSRSVIQCPTRCVRPGRIPIRAGGFGILVTVSSTLSRIPIDSRRRLAATVGLFATLFIAVGAVATTGPGSGGVRAFSALAFVIAALLALTGWGVLRSVRLDMAERKLDEAIARSVAALGRDGAPCACGHEHDLNELHVNELPDATSQSSSDAGASCGQDGHGVSCGHDCGACVLRPKEAACLPGTQGESAAQPAADEAAIGMRPSPSATRADRAARLTS